MVNGKFRLLASFREAFDGNIYRHRVSTVGNRIGRELYEDLFTHQVSPLYTDHVERATIAVDISGRVQNKKMFRRNDSVLGRLPAGSSVGPPRQGCAVSEGPIADARIGCELKIIAKDPLSQIDRVISDLASFGLRVRKISPQSISLAIVGVNHERNYTSYEGDKTYVHPLRGHEPHEAILRIETHLRDMYDELLILPFLATNREPYPFHWLDTGRVEIDYGAMLTRIGDLYQTRFR